MLNEISWSSYWTALTMVTIVYYLYVAVVYYRRDLIEKIWKRPVQPQVPTEMDALFGEVDAYFEQAAIDQPAKPEIIYALRKILGRYNPDEVARQRIAIDKIIRFHSKDKCAVSLIEEDVEQVWLK